jgi:NAD(P)-dependent dehydrogenase (short-subunit alcohol dehydrogenase family)
MKEKFNPFSLDGKTILVTGASSGIGRQTAINISKMGGKLIITGRNEYRLNAVYKKLEGDGHSQFVYDLSKEEDNIELAGKITSIDGIVHCAGIMQPYPVKFIETKQINDIFSINFNSVVLLTGKLLKRKKVTPGGSIVFISSISSKEKPYYGGALYSATKAALDAYCRTVALEHSKFKIRANCISPALVRTNLFDDFMGGIAQPENIVQHEKIYPLGFGEPDDVANAAVYLLSDASRWITGTNLIMDGGLLTSGN